MRILIVALCIFLLQSCGIKQKMEQENIASLYQPGGGQIFPEIKVTPVNDERVLISVRINTNELVAGNAALDTVPRWKLMIRPAYYDNYRKLIPADSLSIIVSKEKNQSTRWVEGEFTQRCKINSEGILQLQVIDLHVNTVHRFRKIINRKNTALELAGELTRRRDSVVLLRPFINDLAVYRIRFPYSKVDSLTMIYFGHNFPMPVPPFSMEKEHQFSFEGDERKEFKQADSFEVRFERPGIYHFLPAGESENGFTVFKWRKGFPSSSKNTEAQSLAYILSREESEELKEQEDGVINFWNSLSADGDQNAVVRKTWLSRTEMANRLFTSYIEGWQTDRGMIYMVFGPPAEVYKSETDENWVIAGRQNFPPLVFSFRKVENPLSDNDYGLQRNPAFKLSWYEAVEKWRRGIF